MQRFYAPDKQLGDTHLSIDDRDHVHQITKVCRAKIGDTYIFFSGDKFEYHYTVESLDRNVISFAFVQKVQNTHKQPCKLTVYQSLPNKLDKCELIVQKLTEIGVNHLVFFPSDHSQIRQIPEKKASRLHKIIIEATEQSGRPSPMSMDILDGQPDYPENITVLDFGGVPTRDILKQDRGSDNFLLVGPEGGWSESERGYFQKNELIVWSLGDGVLRTETASICASFTLLQK